MTKKRLYDATDKIEPTKRICKKIQTDAADVQQVCEYLTECIKRYEELSPEETTMGQNNRLIIDNYNIARAFTEALDELLNNVWQDLDENMQAKSNNTITN